MQDEDLMSTGDAESATEPRRRKRWKSVLIVALLTVLLAIGAALGMGLWVQRDLGGQIERLPDALPTGESRPDVPAEEAEAENILLLGSDKRADGSVAGQRSDTMMVVHVAANRKSVSLVSIPRDSWVNVPGHGPAKINAAFAWGGPALAVETIENLTDIRIDHVAIIDWEGFKALTDALGGITITIPETVKDGYSGKVWTAGQHQMDGATALDYVRQRAGLAGGDFDRIKRQQHFLRTLMSQTLSRNTMSNPRTVYRVLDSVTQNLSVDEDWSTSDLRDLAFSLRSLRVDDVTFTTVPNKGTGMEGAQSVVYLDRQKGEELWQAFRRGKAAEWVRENGAELGASVS